MQTEDRSSRSPVPPAPGGFAVVKLLGGAVLLAGVLALGVFGGRWLRGGGSSGGDPPASPGGASLARAQILFQTYCAKCHGPEGKGDGEGTPSGSPPPRDFRAEKWRFEKSRESIVRVIRDGIPGTSMPAAGKALAEKDLAALAELVLSLSQREKGDRAGDSSSGLAETESGPLALAGFSASAPRLAPRYSIRQAGGETVIGEQLRGAFVLLHFWGTTCTHCLAELSQLEELPPNLPAGRLRVISVCIDESDEEAVQKLGEEFAPGHPVYVDETGLMNHRFSILSLPTYVLIDPQGMIVGTQTGSREWSAERIARLAEYVENWRPALKNGPTR